LERSGRIKSLLNLLAQEPADLFLNYALGLEYVAENDLPAAELQLKKVLQLDETYIAAYYQLGKLFEAQLKNNDALSFYNIGLEKARIQKNNKAINEFGEAIFMLEE
jgi:Tfp pilus assembly protein PilF